MRDKPAHTKRGGRKPILNPELVAAALAELDGNVKATAQRFNVHRSSVQELIDKRPALQKILHDAREGMKDEAESSLYRAVKDGEAWAVCFFLKTQAKDRGYIEKVTDGGDTANKPDPGLDALARLVARLIAQPGGPGTHPQPRADQSGVDAEGHSPGGGVLLPG